MTKPDFQSMTVKELKAYLFIHRNDIEAIHAIVDKMTADPNAKWYPPEDAERFSEIYEEHQKQHREAS
jgi:hypothetical protein